MFSFLEGKKTYLAAIGLFGGALYFGLSEGNWTHAGELFFSALGLLGLRSAVAKVQ